MEDAIVSVEGLKDGFVRPSFRPLADYGKLWSSSVANSPREKQIEMLKDNPRRIASDIMRLFLANKTPITLWGPVGSRKTRSIQALSREVDENGTPYKVCTIQPSTEDPTVIHGMMYTSLDKDGVETVMKRSLPDIVHEIIRYWEEYNGLTVLYLDEMTTCLPAQQHALLGLMTHGQYGSKNILPFISIVMAANPEGTVSTVNELGEQVINRGGHIAWYGDVQLFLEDWGSGFNNPERAPSYTAKWYVTEMLNGASNKAFRSKSDRWTPDSLVPVELFEHSERSVTEFGSMVELIDDVFKDAPPVVRKYYIVEAARALMGNDWADRIEKLAELERNLVSPVSIVDFVRDNGITMLTSADEAKASNFAEKFLETNGQTINNAKASSLMDDLMGMVIRNGVFSLDTYIAAWAFSTLSDSDGHSGGLHRQIVELATRVAASGLKAQVLQRGVSVIPAFVGNDVRERVKVAVEELKRLRAEASKPEAASQDG